MENRISQFGTVTTVDKQTAKENFGALLARNLATGTARVGATASALMPNGALLSAAVNHTLELARPDSLPATGGPVLMSAGLGGARPPVALAGRMGAAAGGVTGATSQPTSVRPDPAESREPIDSQRQLMLENQTWTAQYLSLQNEMQRESRHFTAMSNILKVRHESAKTAINNIR